MKNTLRRLMAGLLAGGFLLAPAHAADLPAKYKEAGKLVVAVDSTFPPMNYRDLATGQIVGVGADMMRALSEELGVEIELVEAAYPQLLPGLETGRFDFIAAAMADMPPRRDKLSFVDYLKTGPQVFARADSAIKTPEDLCGKTVAHARFVTSYPAAVNAFSDAYCVANGKAPIQLVTEDLAVQIGLVQNRFDAGAVTVEAVAYLQQTEPDTYQRVGAPLRDWLYGLAFLKDDTELRDAIAEGVQALIDDGKYFEVLRKHNVEEIALPKVTIDAGVF